MYRPRIAVPEIDQDMTNYVRAIFAAGMEPVLISIQREQVRKKYQKEYLDYSEFKAENYDGLLIPGGGDINPKRYGKENLGSQWIMDDLDQLQLDVLDAFVRREKPVLGICRGHQLINVYFGGTRIQDLPTAARHAHGIGEPDRAHESRCESSSWTAMLYGREFVHNSAHHQAVDCLGEDLVIDGRCPQDGVPEEMHHTKLPVYSVQWHPERMCLAYSRPDTVNGLPVLQFFCRLCGEDPVAVRNAGCANVLRDRMGL